MESSMIVIECDPDEYVVKSLGFPKKSIKHEGGKGKVLGVVRKQEKCIGIIDEDPQTHQPPEMNNYVLRESKQTIKLFVRRNNQSTRIIQISPFLEHWLINRAKQNKISLTTYNLPDNPKKLHDIPHVERNRNFQKFVTELINADEEMKIIKQWIEQTIK